jgi:hypothetical protein
VVITVCVNVLLGGEDLYSFLIFSLNIFYLLKCAKRVRQELNKLMNSSPIYNKLQHYLIQHASIWIFLTLICVNWTRTDNEKKECERGVGVEVCVFVLFVNYLDNKQPFRSLYVFKHVLKNNFVLFIWECRITTGQQLRSETQSLGSKLRFWSNVYLIFV